MPTQRRIEYPGVAMHITQRGNNRRKLFLNHNDCALFMGLLKKYAAKHKVLIHAWCLMPNHIHLLATPTMAKSTGRFMQVLTATYCQYFNRQYRRTGTLYERRFFSSLVDERNYAVMVYRYIELNPVVAGLVKQPDHWQWSSFMHNAWGRPSTILTPHSAFEMLHEHEVQRREIYRELVATTNFWEAEGLAQREHIRTAQRLQSVYGSEEFRELMQDRVGLKLRDPVAVIEAEKRKAAG